MKLTNKEVQEIVAKADAEYDRLKDRVHEQYDEIKRLKEEYVMLQNASDEVEEEKDKEIERLHSIIDELEQWLEEAIETISHISLDGASGLDMALNKIKELKGSDKE